MYQIISIFAYSLAVGYLAYSFLTQTSEPMNLDQIKGIAKIIITPFNLVTNYLFMRYLTNHIKNRLAAMPVLNINSKH